jgi:hypothetical protein
LKSEALAGKKTDVDFGLVEPAVLGRVMHLEPLPELGTQPWPR